MELRSARVDVVTGAQLWLSENKEWLHQEGPVWLHYSSVAGIFIPIKWISESTRVASGFLLKIIATQNSIA